MILKDLYLATDLRCQSKRPIIIKILGELPIVFIGLAVGLGIGLNYIGVRNNIENFCISYESSSNGDRYASSTATPTNKSATGTYSYAAVVADSKRASEIGTDIMARKRGNAIDAAVASLFATGIINAHSCGLGGGSVFVIYDRKTALSPDIVIHSASTQQIIMVELTVLYESRLEEALAFNPYFISFPFYEIANASEKSEWHAVNAKATAPGAASEDLYKGDSERFYIALQKRLNEVRSLKLEDGSSVLNNCVSLPKDCVASV
ncbi:gamma-glutamyltranspeptidase 1 [Plakobranchus ocellatus]|uniref:Gamma-glutamyltranspeptidase 1 n=1 Tax=Plakobranchus ocellatus TaxID=259542 RepID=A0AAV4CXR4_9GAST|nr:gamma-glutamyltranspeptidase 1 [Plakobranchus ocellatus]